MQLEIYSLTALKDQISVSLEAICDSYSSLLWDIEFYQCGCFEVYIAASPQNVSIFQRGRIVARSDDAQHFGIIESLQLETDAEKGDYLTVTGRFIACLLERRIIYPTITANGSYEDIVRKVLTRFRMPYLTVTPLFSVCDKHGYLRGEHEYCPFCDEELLHIHRHE